MSEFLAMGGYAPFVWGSYGVMAAVLIIELLQLKYRRRRLLAWLKRMARLERQQEESQ